MTKNNFFQIAIDGPVAAGKGTIAKMLAAKLHFLYVDTGAMYRTAGLLTADNHIDINLENQEKIAGKLEEAEFYLENSLDENDHLITLVSLNGEDVSNKIRTQKISEVASKVATLPLIRKILVKKQQKLAENFNVVMEGRDIGLRVLPDAQLKLYLTAELEERARRRFLQAKQIHPNITLEEVKKQIEDRDYLDTHREVDPLAVVPDAIVLDTTHLSIEEVVDSIASLVKMHQEAMEEI